MTALSYVTATMAEVLRTRLATASVDTRSFDGRFGADGKDFTTVKAPAVLVSCLGFDEDDDQRPVTVMARFFAVCITRSPSMPDPGPPAREYRVAADVCADLATLVARIVKTERWTGASGDACVGPAQRVRASNDYTNALSAKGHSAWAVTWNQMVELDAEVTPAELNQLSMIHYTLAMGPDGTLDDQIADATPDISIQVDLPEDVDV